MTTVSEAYMEGNASAFNEMHGWLTGAASACTDGHTRASLLVGAEYAASRRAGCREAYSAASLDEPIPTSPEVPGLLTLLRWLLPRRPARPSSSPSFRVHLPCPKCGQSLVIGYLLVDADRRHMHTRYVCTYWPHTPLADEVLEPCGWSGWTVPGWDR